MQDLYFDRPHCDLTSSADWIQFNQFNQFLFLLCYCSCSFWQPRTLSWIQLNWSPCSRNQEARQKLSSPSEYQKKYEAKQSWLCWWLLLPVCGNTFSESEETGRVTCVTHKYTFHFILFVWITRLHRIYIVHVILDCFLHRFSLSVFLTVMNKHQSDLLLILS